MWSGVDILTTDHQVDKINKLLMEDASVSPSRISLFYYNNTIEYIDRIDRLSEKFFDGITQKSYLAVANYRLQLIQSIQILFKSVSEVFTKQIMEVTMHIHTSTDIYTSHFL